MSNGPTKAAPREKAVESGDERYRVKQASFINGSLQPVGAVVQLPKGVKPGKHLELVKDAPAADSDKK